MSALPVAGILREQQIAIKRKLLGVEDKCPALEGPQEVKDGAPVLRVLFTQIL